MAIRQLHSFMNSARPPSPNHHHNTPHCKTRPDTHQCYHMAFFSRSSFSGKISSTPCHHRTDTKTHPKQSTRPSIQSNHPTPQHGQHSSESVMDGAPIPKGYGWHWNIGMFSTTQSKSTIRGRVNGHPTFRVRRLKSDGPMGRLKARAWI